MNKNELSIHSTLMEVIARGDKDTADFIVKSGALDKRPSQKKFNYHNELFPQPEHQYYYSYYSNMDRNIRECCFVEYTLVKECKVKRGDSINKCTWEAGVYTYKDEKVKIYRYREYMINNFNVEEYLTTEKQTLNQVYQYIKESKFDLTDKYPVHDLFYAEDMGYDLLIAKVFLELANRCIDREVFGTSKMSCSHLNVEDYLIYKYDDILSTDTKWWDAQIRKLHKCYDFDSDDGEDTKYFTNKHDFLLDCKLRISGAIEKASYDTENVKKYLVDKGLIKKWVQEVVTDKMWRTWYGITPNGWNVIRNIFNKHNITVPTTQHIVNPEIISSVTALFANEKMPICNDFDKEFIEECNRRGLYL